MAARPSTSIRLSEEEKSLFREAAAHTNETMQDWMRRVCIEKAKQVVTHSPGEAGAQRKRRG